MWTVRLKFSVGIYCPSDKSPLSSPRASWLRIWAILATPGLDWGIEGPVSTSKGEEQSSMILGPLHTHAPALSCILTNMQKDVYTHAHTANRTYMHACKPEAKKISTQPFLWHQPPQTANIMRLSPSLPPDLAVHCLQVFPSPPCLPVSSESNSFSFFVFQHSPLFFGHSPWPPKHN